MTEQTSFKQEKMKQIKANKLKQLHAAHILLTAYSTWLFMRRVQKLYS